jgi:hypothetical protein
MPDRRFVDALRGMLQTEHRRAIDVREGRVKAVGGWAAGHTAATNAFLAPGLALEQLALGTTPTLPAPPDLAQVGGRPMYRPLLAYAVTRAGLRDPSLLDTAHEKASVNSAVGVFWALTLAAAATDTDVFTKLVAGQRNTGEFFDASPYDSPDLHWYDELVVLHAVASYGVLTGDDGVAEAVRRAAEFHTAETQPDHATTQPWAVHAFGAWESTRPLADLLLHGALAQNAGRLDVIGRILIADAVLGLTGMGRTESHE